MSACAEHIQYQLPNEHLCVGFQLEAIQCSHTGLQAAMASIKTDNSPMGMWSNFGDATAHLFPCDSVARKCTPGMQHTAGLISLMGPVEVFGMEGTKPSIWKTSVHLCYHKHHEYKVLTYEEQRELSVW